LAGTASNPRIAIIGGGIGGLALAAFLRQVGLRSKVFEQAATLREVGAGLVIAPNAARLLRRLGVMDQIESTAVRLDIGWEFRRWQDGRILSVEDLTTSCKRLYGEHTYTAHRADLLDAVRSLVPDEQLMLAKRCVGLRQHQDWCELSFADGESIAADIVIGADGIHSIVRATLGEASPPTYSGVCAFRALVPADRVSAFARRRAQTLWIGPDHHFVHYPVSAERLINLVAFAPAGDYTTESWTATATVAEFAEEFHGWDRRIDELITAAQHVGRWALLDRAPLSRWSDGPVTLLGDAAHPMFPFFAQGAAQSLEDAAVLSRCLLDNLGDVPGALRRYERLRLPRTSRLQKVSHGRAFLNHLPDGPEQRARDDAFADSDPLVANSWIYEYDPDLAVTTSPLR
jgi:salicylate hydroxylase